MEVKGYRGDIGSHLNVANSEQAAEASMIEKKRKLKKTLQNLTSREAEERLSKEYGRSINEAESQIVEEITKEIRENADRFV